MEEWKDKGKEKEKEQEGRKAPQDPETKAATSSQQEDDETMSCQEKLKSRREGTSKKESGRIST